jgi:glycine hydroxymethyltransferase
VTSGIRLGTPAMTTRGFGEQEAHLVGHLIADLLEPPDDESISARVREQVGQLTRAFPVYR